MRKYRWFRAGAIIALCFCMVLPVYAVNISDAKSEKEQLEDSLNEVEKIIKGLEGKKSDAEAYMKELDRNLATVSQKLAAVQSNLDNKQAELEDTKKKLEEAKVTEEQQYQDMKKRIRFIYENGNTAYLEMLFESKDFADMLDKADYIKQVSEYDRNMLISYQETKKSIEQKEVQVTEEFAQIEEMKKQAQNQKSSVEKLIQAKKDEMGEYKEQIKKSKDAAAAYEAEIAEQDALIKKLEKEAAEKKRREEAARKAAAAATTAAGKQVEEIATQPSVSGFVWPCPSSKVITSDYGNRLHPIYGVVKMHNGIDIKASTGATIIAAAAGTVISSEYSSSMGNYVMIDHGNETYTIYMHCSGFAVSEGNVVKQGQTIAYVGSTGNSTGPHLHFSVRINGSYVNPRNYVS